MRECYAMNFLHYEQFLYICLQALMKAFHCSEPDSRQIYIVPLVLTLSTYEVYFEDDDNQDTTVNKKTAPKETKLVS